MGMGYHVVLLALARKSWEQRPKNTQCPVWSHNSCWRCNM